MKKLLFLSILLLLFFLLCTGVPAQSRNNIVWDMAVLKWTGSSYQSQPFQRPISMAKDDAYQIMIQAEAESYCYVVMADNAGVPDFVLNTRLKPGEPIYLPEADDDFFISAVSGTLYINVIISRDPVNDLDSLLSQYSGGQRTATLNSAIGERLTSLRSIAATIPATPEETVAIGGTGTRGTFATASRFRDQEIYVKTVTINY